MRRQLSGRHDVVDRPIADHKVVRDDSSMASPPQSLRTHIRAARSQSRLREFAQALFKICGLRVVSVRPERLMLPRGVRRIVALRMTPAAEPLDPSILDSRAFERRRQLCLIELRPSLRGWERSHVGDDCDAMLAEQFEESFDRMRRMPDRKNQRRGLLISAAIARLCRPLSSPSARF